MHAHVFTACCSEFTKIASRAWMRQLQSGAISPKDLTDAVMRSSARADFPQGLIQAPHLEETLRNVVTEVPPSVAAKSPSAQNYLHRRVSHLNNVMGFDLRRDPLALRRRNESPHVRAYEIIQDARRGNPAINAVARATEKRVKRLEQNDREAMKMMHRNDLDVVSKTNQHLARELYNQRRSADELSSELNRNVRLRNQEAIDHSNQVAMLRNSHEADQIRRQQAHKDALDDQALDYTNQLGAAYKLTDEANSRARRNAYLGVGAGIGAGVGGLALGAGGMALANADSQPQPQPPSPTPRPSY